eukprot:36479-Rhodomonas_salina.2
MSHSSSLILAPVDDALGDNALILLQVIQKVEAGDLDWEGCTDKFLQDKAVEIAMQQLLDRIAAAGAFDPAVDCL